MAEIVDSSFTASIVSFCFRPKLLGPVYLESTTMSAVYITCKVLPGLFENEFYVMVNHSAAYYVNRNVVKVNQEPKAGAPVDGVVLGYVVEKGSQESLVQLPGEVVVGGLRTWVENKEITA